jgi:hypothetical protein
MKNNGLVLSWQWSLEVSEREGTKKEINCRKGGGKNIEMEGENKKGGK